MSMPVFAGLDIGLEETHVCVVDGDGARLSEARVATEPEAITAALSAHAARLKRVGFEASSLSPWLAKTLRAAGLPTIVVEARHMAGALGAMRNKTDRNDAEGIAQMMRTGWFQQVHVKSDESHRLRVLLTSRRLLKRKFIDVENTIKGTLEVFGVKMTRTTRGRFEADLRERLRGEDPLLRDVVDGLLAVRRTLLAECDRCHRLIVRVAREDPVCRRFMTVPGVGPITALAYKTTIDDPGRFASAKTVGAHLGLTPKRYQSGTVDRQGRISKRGDPDLRWLLVEAGNSILTKVQGWSVLKAWGMRLRRRAGLRRAAVAVARKLAGILHRMWTEGTDFVAGRQSLSARAMAAATA